MKRIAAMAALVITMLAVPATAAMASTGGPGTGGSGAAALPAGGAEVRHGRREQHAHRGPGPDPGPAQELSYDGDTYTIMSVNPGADSFTVFKDGFLFVNKGTAITGGTGVMCCTR